MRSITTIAGILLIVIGILVLTYQGITYTKAENVAEVNLPTIGSLKVVENKEKTIPLPPVLGGLSLAVGIVLVVIGRINPRK